MKFIKSPAILLSVFLVLYLTVSCTTTRSVNTGIAAGSFVTVSSEYPRYFKTGDGKTWIPIMVNIIIPDGDEEKVFATVEKYLMKFSSNGGNAARIWISSPFLEIEDEEIGKYNPVKLKRIDRLLDIAGKYNVRLKFTLQHIRSISPEQSRRNAWSTRSFYSIEDGGAFRDMKEFINSAQGRSVYLNRARVLSREYKDDPRIFSWELWNEMDAVDDHAWFDFSRVILDSVSALFPNHMVIQTLGSLHSKAAERRYEDMFGLERNVYIPLHRYLDPGRDWDQYDLVRDPADRIASTAVQFAYRDSPLNPVLVNEIGAVEANHAGPSKLYAIDSAGVLAHDMIFAPYFSGAAGCGAMWHWNVYLDHQDLWFHFGRFRNAVNEFDPVKERFKPFYFEKDNVRVYGLKGLNHTILWCRDSRSNWQTELQDGIMPGERTGFQIDAAEIHDGNVNGARVYNPWTDTWSKPEPDNNKTVLIPPFLRSVVVVFQQKGS